MEKKDWQSDLEFTAEELSDLEISRENRSRCFSAGFPRKRTHQRGLRVPADVVPHKSGESALDNNIELAFIEEGENHVQEGTVEQLQNPPPIPALSPNWSSEDPFYSETESDLDLIEESTEENINSAVELQVQAQESSGQQAGSLGERPLELESPTTAKSDEAIKEDKGPSGEREGAEHSLLEGKQGNLELEEAYTEEFLTEEISLLEPWSSEPVQEETPFLEDSAQLLLPEAVRSPLELEGQESSAAIKKPIEKQEDMEEVGQEELEELESQDTLEIPKDIVNQAVKLALEAVSDTALTRTQATATANTFDLDITPLSSDIARPLPAETESPLKESPLTLNEAVDIGVPFTEEGSSESQERINRVSILLSALKPSAELDTTDLDGVVEDNRTSSSDEVKDAMSDKQDLPKVAPVNPQKNYVSAKPVLPAPLPLSPFPLAKDFILKHNGEVDNVEDEPLKAINRLKPSGTNTLSVPLSSYEPHGIEGKNPPDFEELSGEELEEVSNEVDDVESFDFQESLELDNLGSPPPLPEGAGSPFDSMFDDAPPTVKIKLDSLVSEQTVMTSAPEEVIPSQRLQQISSEAESLETPVVGDFQHSAKDSPNDEESDYASSPAWPQHASEQPSTGELPKMRAFDSIEQRIEPNQSQHSGIAASAPSVPYDLPPIPSYEDVEPEPVATHEYDSSEINSSVSRQADSYIPPIPPLVDHDSDSAAAGDLSEPLLKEWPLRTRPVDLGQAIPSPFSQIPPLPQMEEPPRKPIEVTPPESPKERAYSSPQGGPPPISPTISSAREEVSSLGTGRSQVRGRKRPKLWFEEIFDEDYLRTLQPYSSQQTKKEVDFLEESLQPANESQLLDLGCGAGRHAIELASRGYHLTGFDLSLALLLKAADEAQRRKLQINFIHGDFREFSFEEQFDAIYCIANSFGYFDDDANRRMIQAINKALRVGGRFLLDVVNRDYLIRDLPARIWWEGMGCVVLEEIDFNYFTSRVLSKRSVVFEDGRHLDQEISIRSYSLHELGKILHHAGFRVLEVTGNVAHRTRFFGNHSRSLILLAEKRTQ